MVALRNTLITFLISTSAFGQGLLKYSTIYSSVYAASPMEAQTEYFVTQAGDLIDVTIENPFDYRYTFGIRRVARYDYENRQNRFYDGHNQSTTSLSAAVGAVKGWEYLAQYDRGRQQGRDYINQRYFLRYLHKNFMIKGELFNQGLVDLNYTQIETRARLHLGELDFSIGVAGRQNKAYGYNPISIYLQNNAWWDLAHEYGYQDIYYQIDYDLDDVIDNWNWYWIKGDERVASTDEDFRRYIYGNIVNDFNKARFDEVGTLASLSAIFGVDYYHYTENFWIHSWSSILPYHRHIFGNEEFSFNNFVDGNQWIDYTFGGVLGYKIGLRWGVFAEGEYMQYWDREVFTIKAGINYQIR